jgi:hypothetical protein
MKWKPNWPQTRRHFIDWWAGQGLLLAISAPRSGGELEASPAPAEQGDPEFQFTNVAFRRRLNEHQMAGQWYGSDWMPMFDNMIGPGSLGTFLGARPVFEPTTVWYEPCISDADVQADRPIRFDPDNHWFKVHMALLEEGLRSSAGRYLVGVPDLIESLDTLAAMRGSEQLLLDLIERPGWVHRRLEEINEAFFAAFERMYKPLSAQEGGGNAFCAFHIWGPGRTAKVQCDFSAMISPAMFRQFVVPHMSRQCERLDYALYHLDGTTCLQHLEALLEMPGLKAIEWTPQAGLEGGGHRRWFELYRRIRSAGKAVQAVGVEPDEVLPLIDAVGPEGLYVLCSAPDQATAEKLLAAAR